MSICDYVKVGNVFVLLKSIAKIKQSSGTEIHHFTLGLHCLLRQKQSEISGTEIHPCIEILTGTPLNKKIYCINMCGIIQQNTKG